MSQAQRVASHAPHPATANPGARSTAYRWSILRAQIARGEKPCFGTEHRHVCEQYACRFRQECLAMRAHWMA